MPRPENTLDDLYATLRRTGEVYLPADQANRAAGLRRRATSDGLRLVQARAQGRTTYMSRSQMRARPVIVNLVAADGVTIIRPDATQGAPA